MIVYRELKTLERDLDIPIHRLYALSNSITRHYHTVSIPKQGGSFRTLSVPDETLKQVQRRIADRLLSHMPISKYAVAYRRGKSTKDAARPHVGATQILKLDIRNFFDGVMYSHVKHYAFPEEIYAEPLRVLLSILCYYKDVLPQGAPTSPAITNLVLRDFDEAVGAWCSARGIRYTRYCDDMIFSGCGFDTDEVKGFVKDSLKDYGLYLNPQKTKLLGKGNQKIVTGIVVNHHLAVPASFRRSLRQQIYYCQRYGVSEHLAHIGCSDTPERYLRRLAGRVNYALSINAGDTEMQKYRAWMKEALKNL